MATRDTADDLGPTLAPDADAESDDPDPDADAEPVEVLSPAGSVVWAGEFGIW